MGCLIGTIKLRTCSTEVVEGDIFINDVHGISLRMLDSVADEEAATFYQLFVNSEVLAEEKFYQECFQYFKNCWQVKNLQCVKDYICADENYTQFLTAWKYYLAAELTIARRLSDRNNIFTLDEEAITVSLEYYREEFVKSIRVTVESLDLNPCDCSGTTYENCFECGEGELMRVFYNIP